LGSQSKKRQEILGGAAYLILMVMRSLAAVYCEAKAQPLKSLPCELRGTQSSISQSGIELSFSDEGGKERFFSNAGRAETPSSDEGDEQRPFSNAGQAETPSDQGGEQRSFSSAGRAETPFEEGRCENRGISNVDGQGIRRLCLRLFPRTSVGRPLETESR
jgi:hypothetical protein